MTDKHSRLRIVLVSGPVCAGKSALVSQLQDKHGARVLKTKDLILQISPKTKVERRTLQLAGQRLDNADGGEWVAKALQQLIDRATAGRTPEGLFVVDSVRISGQIEAARRAYGAEVHHIHLTATAEELRRRYERRHRHEDAGVEYDKLKRNRTEKGIELLAPLADIVVHTDRCSESAVLVRATALLDLYPRSNQALVDVLIGGQYGSEGKGNIVGHIAPEYDLLVRVGGPNAGHQVYAEPTPEKYFHLPSGTGRAPNARLLLGPGAVIYPPKLLEEVAAHKVTADRLTIDEQAMIISEADIREEQRLFQNISSTAQGVGVASARKMIGRSDYKSGNARFLAKDIPDLRPYIGSARKEIADAAVRKLKILLEGTQGTTLSLHHGYYPHVTTRDTTVSGCLADAGISPFSVRKLIMVCRTYPIRVGGPSGPMDYEVSLEDICSRSSIALDELRTTETTTTTGRQRRIAEFDWEQFRDSVQLNGPTDIALTFVDYLGNDNRTAYRFEQLNDDTIQFVQEIEQVSGRRVSLISTDFGWRNVIDRRAW